MAEFMTAKEASKLIGDNSNILVCGNLSMLEPDTILKALEERFLSEGRPRNLTIVHPTNVGHGKGTGLNRFAHKGMVRRFIGGSFPIWPNHEISAMLRENKVEAYNLPMGTIFRLIRAIAEGKPVFITQVGLHTYIDPRVEGGRMNEVTKEDLGEVLNLNGEEWLLYKTFPIDIAIIRGTTADEKGNISLEQEVATLGILYMAMAAKNSGGKVIVQVKRKAVEGSLHPRMVKVPGALVDAIVVDEGQFQTSLKEYNPALSGEMKVSLGLSTLPLNEKIERMIIAKRAFQEIKEGQIVNLGYGIPAIISQLALKNNFYKRVNFTIEHGPFGGVPEGMEVFGASSNPDTIMDTLEVFDFYNGGGIDVAFLSFAQVDRKGNVNVSKFMNRNQGCGGFIDITYRTRKIIFCGTFTTKGLEIECKDGKLNICQEGKVKKFVKNVEQITFNGKQAIKKRQEVIFITERGVFKFTKKGMELLEVAPGIDIKEDILANAEFDITISDKLKKMSRESFIG